MVMGELVQDTQVLVIGAGPGGYAAAFRAADLGLEVTLVDTAEQPGGVCLFRGCIPSKALLHVAELLHDTRKAKAMGITFGTPKIDLAALRHWKQNIITSLSKGLVSLTSQRNIQYIRGLATFESPNSVRLSDAEVSRIRFQNAIVATGSQPILLPGRPLTDSPRIMTSTEALELADIPATLLVIGGGYVGLELGSVYAALGSRVTLVELGPRLLPGVDQDLVRILERQMREQFAAIHLNTQVAQLEVEVEGDRLRAVLKGSDAEAATNFERALVAIGRKPNSSGLDLEKAQVVVDAHGFIQVDNQQRTGNRAIYAVGDVVGGVMLAHKASYEGKIAAEVIAAKASAFDARAIPAVVYTDPQVAWVGLTEAKANDKGMDIEVKRFPWKMSGRAATMGLEDGLTKMIADRRTRRILGVGIVGRSTEGMISEAVLAIEMGALVDDVALSIHPHPTLSETEAETAELFLGSATHMLAKNR